MLRQWSISEAHLSSLTRGLMTHPRIGEGFVPTWKKWVAQESDILFNVRDVDTGWIMEDCSWSVMKVMELAEWVIDNTPLDDEGLKPFVHWLLEPGDIADPENVLEMLYLAHVDMEEDCFT